MGLEHKEQIESLILEINMMRSNDRKRPMSTFYSFFAFHSCSGSWTVIVGVFTGTISIVMVISLVVCVFCQKRRRTQEGIVLTQVK